MRQNPHIMKTIRKKDIRSQFETALNLIVQDLPIKPSKKIKLIVKSASKKIGAQVKAELKKQEAANKKAKKAEEKALKKEIKAGKKATRKNKPKAIVAN